MLEKRSMLTGEEDMASRAGELVFLVVLTHVRDMLEGQIENKDLDEAGESRGHNLGHEHSARRNLHIVTKLEI